MYKKLQTENIEEIHGKDIKMKFRFKRSYIGDNILLKNTRNRDNVVRTESAVIWKEKENSKWITIVKECAKRGKHLLKKRTRKQRNGSYVEEGKTDQV